MSCRIAAMFLVAAIGLSLAGCSNGPANDPGANGRFSVGVGVGSGGLFGGGFGSASPSPRDENPVQPYVH